jgi:hypothetical protein
LFLYYNFEGSIDFIKTDDEIWHELMNHNRHVAFHISEMHLMISKGFWNLARWRDGVQKVLEQNSLGNRPIPKNFPNFLTKIAKIAAPAPRWRNYDRKWEIDDYDPEKDSHYSSHGTKLHITIDGADSGERQTFVQELEEIIEETRRARPLFRWGSIYTRTAAERTFYRRRAANKSDSP